MNLIIFKFFYLYTIQQSYYIIIIHMQLLQLLQLLSW